MYGLIPVVERSQGIRDGSIDGCPLARNSYAFSVDGRSKAREPLVYGSSLETRRQVLVDLKDVVLRARVVIVSSCIGSRGL